MRVPVMVHHTGYQSVCEHQQFVKAGSRQVADVADIRPRKHTLEQDALSRTSVCDQFEILSGDVKDAAEATEVKAGH